MMDTYICRARHVYLHFLELASAEKKRSFFFFLLPLFRETEKEKNKTIRKKSNEHKERGTKYKNKREKKKREKEKKRKILEIFSFEVLAHFFLDLASFFDFSRIYVRTYVRK